MAEGTRQKNLTWPEPVSDVFTVHLIKNNPFHIIVQHPLTPLQVEQMNGETRSSFIKSSHINSAIDIALFQE